MATSRFANMAAGTRLRRIGPRFWRLPRATSIAPLKVLTYPGEAAMLDITKDIQAMTTFRRNPGKFMKHLKKTKKPLVLTINGKAEAVVQDAEAYQRLLDIAAQADAIEGIRQGTEDMKKRRVRPAREALEMFRSNVSSARRCREWPRTPHGDRLAGWR